MISLRYRKTSLFFKDFGFAAALLAFLLLFILSPCECETTNFTGAPATTGSANEIHDEIVFSPASSSFKTQPPSKYSDHPNFKHLPPRDACGLVPKLRTVNLESRKKRVVGGRISHPGYLPGIAVLKLRNPQVNEDTMYTAGGGALITTRYVLTSAYTIVHRATRGSGNVLEAVGFRRNLIVDNQYAVGVESVIVHPNFNPATRANDIALIRLAKDVHLNSTHNPICLPLFENEQEQLSATTCTEGDLVTAGWGQTRSTVIRVPTYANYIEMKLRPAEHCSRVYSRVIDKIGDGQICASSCLGERTGLCGTADAGALLMSSNELAEDDESRQYTLHGLASYFDKCGNYGLPSVYTNVSHYIPWILDSMRD